MEINVSLLTGGASPFHLEAINGAGRTLQMDGSPAIGGADAGFRPMETVLAGLAGCSGVDILTILKRGRQEVKGFSVKVSARRAETDPKVFTHIDIHFAVKGEVTEKRLEQAVGLSMEKYCSVAAMLHKTATIKASYSLEN